MEGRWHRIEEGGLAWLWERALGGTMKGIGKGIDRGKGVDIRDDERCWEACRWREGC